MGYTHYWYREKRIDPKTFKRIVDDFEKLVPILAKTFSLKLAGGLGVGKPQIDYKEVCFNGLQNCGHKKQEFCIAWPKDTARGSGDNGSVVCDTWFAGAVLNKRACDGDCSHETFYFPLELPERSWGWQQHDKKTNLLFNFTKTAFKPYDLAVNIFLIIAKHYLKDRIRVSSDGTLNNWLDATQICHKFLGYGYDFKLGDD